MKDLFYTNGDKTIILISIGFYCKQSNEGARFDILVETILRCITDFMYHTNSPGDLKVF